MAETASSAETEEFLEGIAAELAAIHRGSDYSQWRGEATYRVNDFLSRADPFADFASAWVFNGDGGGSIVGTRFGEWAIDQLVDKRTPQAIISQFKAEVERNAAIYEDISPIIGVEIVDGCDVGAGVRLVPPADPWPGQPEYSWRHRWPPMPSGTGFLVQRYEVSPGFERRPMDAKGPIGISATVPPSTAREAVRARCRLACLLASTGGVELPMSITSADQSAALTAGGGLFGRPLAPHPLVAFPLDIDLFSRSFAQLETFVEFSSLARAIDRLGRSRLAIHPVDRALDLGMAAEIALMHDQGSSKTEITFKIASRAGWLLGEDAKDRARIFGEIKDLYAARSIAVHSGVLPSKNKVDLDAADALVARVLRSILALGRFPDWMNMTMGGG